MKRQKYRVFAYVLQMTSAHIDVNDSQNPVWCHFYALGMKNLKKFDNRKVFFSVEWQIFLPGRHHPHKRPGCLGCTGFHLSLWVRVDDRRFGPLLNSSVHTCSPLQQKKKKILKMFLFIFVQKTIKRWKMKTTVTNQNFFVWRACCRNKHTRSVIQHKSTESYIRTNILNVGNQRGLDHDLWHVFQCLKQQHFAY